MKIFLSFFFTLSMIPVCFPQDNRPQTANEVLNNLQNKVVETLLEGNKRYVEEKMNQCRERSSKKIREELNKGQKPYAIILSCSDSRVPPELVFDQGPGDIFVIRVAGNTFDPVILGSIEYAAEHLGTPLVMVLGHERCGAVTATVQSHGPAEGNVGSILSLIHPAVVEAKKKVTSTNPSELIEASIDENIHYVARKIYSQSSVLRHLIDLKKLKIVEAKFDLDDGKVSLFPEQKFEPVPEKKHVAAVAKKTENKIILRKTEHEVAPSPHEEKINTKEKNSEIDGKKVTH